MCDGYRGPICDHVIGVETTLQTILEDDETFRCSWSALDFSEDPPRDRDFVAIFDDEEIFSMFQDAFNEALQMARDAAFQEQGGDESGEDASGSEADEEDETNLNDE